LQGEPASAYDYDSGFMGLCHWTGAATLCEYMASEPSMFENAKSVLELGAGPGLCGLVHASLWCGRTVVVTDGHQAACSLITKNIGLNKMDAAVHSCRLRWGSVDDHAECDEDIAALPLQSYDCIIASDCFFNTEVLAPFTRTAARLLTSGGALVLSVPGRNASKIEPLIEACDRLKLGLVATVAPATFSSSPLDPRGRICCFERQI
jgi:predicted nicotinamide N-methyase